MLIAREGFRTRPVCVYISVPAFTLPRPRSHFPRMAFGGAHEEFSLPPQ